jgi:hypothetical protein
VSVLNQWHTVSAPRQAGLQIERIPFVAHTVNLGLGDFSTEWAGGRLWTYRKQWLQFQFTLGPFQRYPEAARRALVQSWEITKNILIHWSRVVGFLKDKEEADALKRLDVGRLNEVIVVFTQFIKSADGNHVSYSNISEMLQK